MFQRLLGPALFASAVVLLAIIFVLLRLSVVTDYMYHATVKDPVRSPPEGRVIVAPADGTVLYVRRIENGTMPEVIKRGVAVPLVEHTKAEPGHEIADGYLIGIYMNTQGVHINRVPNHGRLLEQTIFNGPHMDMTAAERTVILSQLVPGKTTLRKLLGRPPFDIEDEADFVLRSARETLVFEDERGVHIYVIRIADYYVGKILTWIEEGASVSRGDKLGMITWGSQTDLMIETTPELKITVEAGDYVYGGETVVATY